MAGQRRQKILARERHKEEQEKERLIEVQTAEREAAEQRKATIEKAKRMIYWRDERVGKLHSKVILDRVLYVCFGDLCLSLILLGTSTSNRV